MTWKISDLKEQESMNAHNSKVDVKDPVVIEAGEIMVDFIELLAKRIVSSHYFGAQLERRIAPV